jgi:hypothetical protein
VKPHATRLAGGALAVLILTLAAASVAVALTGAAASVRTCSESQLAIWIGDGPGGATAGTTFYPLEFSNISHRSCSLYGYPGVSATSSRATQVGKPATRNGKMTRLVVLAPAATGHATLGLVDWGAVCRRALAADGIRVYAPGDTTSELVYDFPFQTCANASTLRVDAISAGIGIPGYTAS